MAANWGKLLSQIIRQLCVKSRSILSESVTDFAPVFLDIWSLTVYVTESGHLGACWVSGASWTAQQCSFQGEISGIFLTFIVQISFFKTQWELSSHFLKIISMNEMENMPLCLTIF